MANGDYNPEVAGKGGGGGHSGHGGGGHGGGRRPHRPGHTAGGHTRPPPLVEEICSTSEEPTCDPEYKYRTINGECNNLGCVNIKIQ